MTRNLKILRDLGLVTLLVLTTACASSPLYSGNKRGSWTVGEIPRDARGEPVWAAIPPVPNRSAFNQPPAAAQQAALAAPAEGDAEDFPKPRTR